MGREHSQAFSHAWPPGQDLVGAQALHLGVAKGTEGTRSWVLSQYSGKSAPLPSVPEPLPGASAWSSVDQVGGLLDPTMKEKAIRAPEPGCLHSFKHSLIHSANACGTPRPPLNRTDEEPRKGAAGHGERRCRSPEGWSGSERPGTKCAQRASWSHTAIITVHSGTLSCLKRSPRACPWWLPDPSPRQPAVCFLSLWIPLFRTFCADGIIAVCALGGLGSVTKHHVVKAHPCCSRCRPFRKAVLKFFWPRRVLGAARGSSIFTVACGILLAAACEIQFPDQGSNPGPLPWELRASASGPPGRSPLRPFSGLRSAPLPPRPRLVYLFVRCWPFGLFCLLAAGAVLL